MTKIVAPDGYVYFNGETSGKVVYLGKNDSADNWKLISEDELTEVEKATETEQKAQAYDIITGVVE